MNSRILMRLTALSAIAVLAGCGGSGVKEPAQLAQPQQPAATAAGISRESVLPQPQPKELIAAESMAGNRRVSDAARPLIPAAKLELRSASSIAGFDRLNLPPLPVEDGSQSPLRSVSDVHLGDLSNPYDSSANATKTPTLLTLTAPEGGISWAVFQMPLAVAEVIAQLQFHGQITASPNGANSGLYLGFPDYDKGVWTFQPPANVTNSSLVPLSPLAPLVSPGNNFYVLVLAYDGDIIELNHVALVTSNPTPPLLPDEFGFALSYIGLDESKLGMDQLIPGLTGANQWTWTGYSDLLTMMDSFWNCWYVNADELPTFTKTKGEDLQATQSLQDLLLEATGEFQSEHQIGAQQHSETLDPGQPLAKAIADLVTTAGGTADQASYNTAVGGLTLDDQNALAVVVEATRRALEDRNGTMDDYNANTWGGTLDQTALDGWFAAMHGAWLSNDSYIPVVYDVSSAFRFLRSFPYEGFFVPAARLADAIDDLTTYMGGGPTFEDVSLDVSTPAGNITIGGTGNDTHNSPGADGHLLLIDLGGSDTYNCNAGGTASYANGVSVCIDLDASDIYNMMDDPLTPDRTALPSDDNTSQQGAGRLGIGILVDYEGDDEYHSVRLSQGSAVLGVGICADYGGIDKYDMEALGQGGAFGGVGILFDAGGDDEYRNIRYSGGFGGIMGVGFLVDQGTGTDLYRAEPDKDDTMPEYISVDDPLKNRSLCFGSAWGKTLSGDPGTDPVVGSGGFGFCADGGGDDTYLCGVSGLGFSFYEGMGLLYDAEGLDTYDGWIFSQGAATHASVAALFDIAGNDGYTNHFSSGLGGAYDASIAWMLDMDGTDGYEGSNGCIGAGRANANAYFVDWLGADTYTVLESDGENMTLGKAGESGGGATVGVFCDAKGDDTYDAVYDNMLAGTDDAGTLVINPTPTDLVHWVRINGNTNAGHGFYPGGLGVGYDGQ